MISAATLFGASMGSVSQVAMLVIKPKLPVPIGGADERLVRHELTYLGIPGTRLQVRRSGLGPGDLEAARDVLVALPGPPACT